MRQTYRGFELWAEHEQSLGGETMLYYTVMRTVDKWLMEDSFTSGAESESGFIEVLKRKVDAYYADPLEWEAADYVELHYLVSELLYSFTPEQIGAIFQKYAEEVHRGEHKPDISCPVCGRTDH